MKGSNITKGEIISLANQNVPRVIDFMVQHFQGKVQMIKPVQEKPLMTTSRSRAPLKSRLTSAKLGNETSSVSLVQEGS